MLYVRPWLVHERNGLQGLPPMPAGAVLRLADCEHLRQLLGRHVFEWAECVVVHGLRAG